MMDNSDPIIANGNSVPNGNSLMMDSSEPIIANGNYVPNGNSSEPIIADGNSSEPIIANGNYVPNGNSSEPIIANGNSSEPIIENGNYVPNGNSSSSSVLAQNKPRVLLAACGCVTAANFVDLCREFSEWAEVKAVITKSSSEFIDFNVPSLDRDVNLYCDEHELLSWRSVDGYSYVLHNALASWAEVLVIAPLSAHTLAKIAGGLCDNLLTNVVKAWDRRKSFVVAPSMNKFMWRNPITVKQCRSIEEELGITVIEPCVGEYDCAMAAPEIINELVRLGYD